MLLSSSPHYLIVSKKCGILIASLNCIIEIQPLYLMPNNKGYVHNMKTYHTSEIASMIGVHANTVRFYEEQELLPPIPRTKNGYRVYAEHHLRQLRLIRLAFRAEVLSNNLRTEVTDVVKTAATGDYDNAIQKAACYQSHIRDEISKAQEAISLTEQILAGEDAYQTNEATVGRKEAAARIGVSIDVLRDWERNGLIQITRKGNRRQYGESEMRRLKIISILRHANYSQMSIRRMLKRFDQGETDLLSALDTPEETEDIISVADRYISSLVGALDDTEEMLRLLENIKP